MVERLPPRLADELVARRVRNAVTASVDESVHRPAIERYDCHFYDSGRWAIETLVIGVRKC